MASASGREDHGLVRARQGRNVWYFGEETATYDEQGHLIDTEGSWEAGENGAIAEMIMPADPRPTDAYRQEISRGEAWSLSRHQRNERDSANDDDSDDSGRTGGSSR